MTMTKIIANKRGILLDLDWDKGNASVHSASRRRIIA